MAVAVLGESMIMLLEVASKPEASPVQPENMYRVLTPAGTMLGVMEACVDVPLLYHPEPVTFP